MHKTIKGILTRYMPVRYMLTKGMLTGRNQDLHVFIGMIVFLVVAYFVGV